MANMAKFNASEAKTHFDHMLARVGRGEEILVTRRGRPVARLIPAGITPSHDARPAVEGLRALQQRIRQRSRAKLSDAEVRTAIR